MCSSPASDNVIDQQKQIGKLKYFYHIMFPSIIKAKLNSIYRRALNLSIRFILSKIMNSCHIKWAIILQSSATIKHVVIDRNKEMFSSVVFHSLRFLWSDFD